MGQYQLRFFPKDEARTFPRLIATYVSLFREFDAIYRRDPGVRPPAAIGTTIRRLEDLARHFTSEDPGDPQYQFATHADELGLLRAVAAHHVAVLDRRIERIMREYGTPESAQGLADERAHLSQFVRINPELPRVDIPWPLESVLQKSTKADLVAPLIEDAPQVAPAPSKPMASESMTSEPFPRGSVANSNARDDEPPATRWFDRVRRHPAVAVAVVVGTVVIALAAFTDSIEKLVDLGRRVTTALTGGPEPPAAETPSTETPAATFPLVGHATKQFSSARSATCEVQLDSTGLIRGEITLENDALLVGFSVTVSVALVDAAGNAIDTVYLGSCDIGGKPPGKAITKNCPLEGRASAPTMGDVRRLDVSLSGGT